METFCFFIGVLVLDVYMYMYILYVDKPAIVHGCMCKGKQSLAEIKLASPLDHICSLHPSKLIRVLKEQLVL